LQSGRVNATDTRLPATRARSTTQIPASCPIRPITWPGSSGRLV